jgi:amino-acid N-acetyltransferase
LWRVTRIASSAARYWDGALLRSVAVEASMQGRGVGRKLVAATVKLAHTRHVSAIYLLTTTADGFFSRLGFDRVTRADVPTQVPQSIEFLSACPSSATVMRKRL